jgi:hypothetical protein
MNLNNICAQYSFDELVTTITNDFTFAETNPIGHIGAFFDLHLDIAERCDDYRYYIAILAAAQKKLQEWESYIRLQKDESIIEDAQYFCDMYADMIYDMQKWCDDSFVNEEQYEFYNYVFKEEDK